MIKLLAALFGLIDKLVGYYRDRKLVEQGREEAINEVAEKVDQNVQAAKDAVSTSDPLRDERLRNRFDRSRKVN